MFRGVTITLYCCCITRKPWLSSSVILYDSNGIAHNQHTNIHLHNNIIITVYDKALELGMSFVFLYVEAIKALAVALVLPMLNVVFGMITEDGSLTLEMAMAML